MDEETSGSSSRLVSSMDEEKSGSSSFVEEIQYHDEERKTTCFLLGLTAGFIGLQGLFTVLFGSGNAYLTSIGFSQWGISLSWLAGPLAGMIFQPLVGAMSDRHHSRWGKRRPYIVVGTILSVLSLLTMSHARAFVEVLLPRYPRNRDIDIASYSRDCHLATLILVEVCIWILNFAIQPIQMGLRALIVDVAPLHQQNQASSWASRSTLIGNVVGYGLSTCDLTGLSPGLGATQFQVLCSLTAIILCVCVTTTCCVGTESNSELSNSLLPQGKNRGPKSQAPRRLLHVWMRLHRVVRKVCAIQFMTWLGWFTFLFYASSYVEERDDRSKHEPWPKSKPGRIGSIAMAIFAWSSLAAAWILPFVSHIMARLYRYRPQNTSLQSDRLSMRSLGRIWAFCNALFSIAMLFTFIPMERQKRAGVIMTLAGVSWAGTSWIPFALVSQELRQLSPQGNCIEVERKGDQEFAATVIGVHNIAIAAPQIVSALASGLFFWIAGRSDPGTSTGLVVWLLRAGSIPTLAAACLCIMLLR